MNKVGTEQVTKTLCVQQNVQTAQLAKILIKGGIR